MSEQIIIDGVDVSGCEWFGQIDLDINVICTSNSPKKCSAYCKDNPNCCYKQFVREKQECEELKKNETMLISNLQLLWGQKIAEEQGDCKNIDYTKPVTREIYNTISEIERTLKDIAFAQSVQIGKTKPLGETGSPRSYRNWENKSKKLLEREFLK